MLIQLIHYEKKKLEVAQKLDLIVRFNKSGLEKDKDLLLASKLNLKNLIQRKKQSFFQERFQEDSHYSEKL